MKTRIQALALMVLAVSLALGGCAQIQAKAAFKDGNKAYKDEDFKLAIDEYQQVISLDPGNAAAYFYLASSHQALYRPAKETPENAEHLSLAVENYKVALEKAGAGTDQNDPMLRSNALSALTAIYSEQPYRDFNTAQAYAEQLVAENPNDLKNLFAMANLYEKFDRFDLAEQAYERAAELNPSDIKACGALAAFYNKPLWEGKSRFDDAISTLQRCAQLAPDDPTGWYKVSSFYWDKAYRDPLLDDTLKEEYADKGLEAVNRSLELKPDYIDALVYKGLLFRVKAQVSRNPRERFEFLEQAGLLQKQALELKKQQAEAEAAAAQQAASGAS